MKEKHYKIISIGSFLLATFLLALWQNMPMSIGIKIPLSLLIYILGVMAFTIPVFRIDALSGNQLLGE